MSGWVGCGGVAAAFTLPRTRGVFGVYERSAGEWSPLGGPDFGSIFLGGVLPYSTFDVDDEM